MISFECFPKNRIHSFVRFFSSRFSFDPRDSLKAVSVIDRQKHLFYRSKQVHRGIDLRCLFLTCFVCLPGCGGPAPCTVNGYVTFKTVAIKKGAIRFFTEKGTPGSGGLAPIVDGEYSINAKGMFAGKYLVAISGFEATGRKFVPEPGAAEVTEERQFLPAKFNSKSKTIVELKKGTNTEDFDLTE